MKILILTYYFPPAGGSGVQRWLKFVKYLHEFDIEPIVYTIDNPNYAITDESLFEDIPKNVKIIKKAIIEPNAFFRKSSKKQQSAGFLNKNPTYIGRISQYIRANYFIPDARKFWIKPSVKFLRTYLKENPVELIITTGPPHSVHLIGLALKKITDIKWVADFRDPWTDIDYFHQLPLTKKSILKHHLLEQEVLSNADDVIVVGKTMQEKYQKFNKNTHIITNGFDSFNDNSVFKLDEKFSLLHIGMLNSDRNHRILWDVLNKMIIEIPTFKNDLEIKLIGKVCPETIEDINTFHLSKYLNHIDYIKHKDVFKHQKSAQILLLLINNVPSAKGIITGKIFEYLQAERPILAIAPKDGDLAGIIKHTHSGTVIDFKDEKKLKKHLIIMYKNYKNDTLAINSKNVKQYHRKYLTKKLAEVIKK